MAQIYRFSESDLDLFGLVEKLILRMFSREDSMIYIPHLWEEGIKDVREGCFDAMDVLVKHGMVKRGTYSWDVKHLYITPKGFAYKQQLL